MTVLVTGAAGFIGYHTVKRLCLQGLEVIGLDNLNDYYSVALKRARLEQLSALQGFHFQKMDIVDKPALMGLFNGIASPKWCTWRRKRAFVTRNTIRMPMLNPTWWAS